MAFVWWVFARKDTNITTTTIRHEQIHLCQQKEMLVVFFFLWYGIEWIVRLIQYRNTITAYKNISFEREAYYNQLKEGYLEIRKHYSFLKHLRYGKNQL